MPFTVRCPHCDTLLKVPDEYHYKIIPCPKCKKEIEAVSLETIEIGEQFIRQLEEQDSDMIIDESRPASRRYRKPGADVPAPEPQEDDNEIPPLKNS